MGTEGCRYHSSYAVEVIAVSSVERTEVEYPWLNRLILNIMALMLDIQQRKLPNAHLLLYLYDSTLAHM